MKTVIIVALTGLSLWISWMPHESQSFWSQTEQEGNRSPRKGPSRRDVKPAGAEQVL